jgi:hypothetical protein
MQNKAYIGLAVGAALVVLGAIIMRRQTVAPRGPTAKAPIAQNVGRGSVTLPEAVRLVVADAQGKLFTFESGKPADPIPAGEYRVRSWRIERKDDQGNRWLLTGQGFGSQSRFVVSAGASTKLDVGEPVVATLIARKTGSGRYSFSPVLKGRLGESIELTRGGYRAPAPKLHVKNKDGTYDRTFNFAYG